MSIYLGDKGLIATWQEKFTPTVECHKCNGEARIMFVYCEDQQKSEFVAGLRNNGGEHNYWPHDAIACAVYLCKDCFEPTAILNQA